MENDLTNLYAKYVAITKICMYLFDKLTMATRSIN